MKIHILLQFVKMMAQLVVVLIVSTVTTITNWHKLPQRQKHSCDISRNNMIVFERLISKQCSRTRVIDFFHFRWWRRVQRTLSRALVVSAVMTIARLCVVSICYDRNKIASFTQSVEIINGILKWTFWRKHPAKSTRLIVLEIDHVFTYLLAISRTVKKVKTILVDFTFITYAWVMRTVQ